MTDLLERMRANAAAKTAETKRASLTLNVAHRSLVDAQKELANAEKVYAAAKKSYEDATRVSYFAEAAVNFFEGV